uniref:ATP-dependent DNA helicase n=1 Tax=Lactuca sativa TaxID=4236 RepID=A0A9R1VZG3_LACSA|nr:hypothetical protein LSAT_V11C400203860 [Lactuca sativa]
MRLYSFEITDCSLLSTLAFATWLLNIGDGRIGVPDKDEPRDSSWIRTPYSLLISPGPDSLQTLIDFVYGDDMLNDPTDIHLSHNRQDIQ